LKQPAIRLNKRSVSVKQRQAAFSAIWKRPLKTLKKNERTKVIFKSHLLLRPGYWLFVQRLFLLRPWLKEGSERLGLPLLQARSTTTHTMNPPRQRSLQRRLPSLRRVLSKVAWRLWNMSKRHRVTKANHRLHFGIMKKLERALAL